MCDRADTLARAAAQAALRFFVENWDSEFVGTVLQARIAEMIRNEFPDVADRIPSSDCARPTFVIRLRAAPDVDAVRAVRASLKVALRRFGLRALSIDTEPEGSP
jgi:hypothetical protein